MELSCAKIAPCLRNIQRRSMAMEAEKFGKFIAALRKEKEITQAELAEKLHVTDKAVSRWERGLGYPDIHTLEPLADALGVTLTELMKCEKGTEDQTDEGILVSLEIAKIQRKKARKRFIKGGLCCLIGLAAVLYAVHVYLTETWSLVVGSDSIWIGGADGPTAIFVAGRIGKFPPLMIGGLGVLVLGYGIYTIVKSNN